MKTILLDVDGIVGNFVKALCVSTGHCYNALMSEYPPGLFWFTDLWGWTIADYRQHMRGVGSDFWRNIEPYEEAKEFYDWLCKKAEVFFLTHPFDGAAIVGKDDWLRKWTDDINFTRYVATAHKHLCVAPDTLLIDDADHNVESWLKAAEKKRVNAEAILFPRVWNQRHAERHDPYETVKREVELWLTK